MLFTKIQFKNIGPIEHAEIGRHKLSVFVGPNNTGKSIASRIMHGVCQLDMSAKVQLRLFGSSSHSLVQGKEMAAARSSAVLRSAGIRWRDVVTYSMNSGRLDVESDDGARTTVDFDRYTESSRAAFFVSILDNHTDEEEFRNSIYVPAGRTGTVQSLLAIMQIKNDLLNSVLRSLGERPGRVQGQKGSGRALQGLRLKRQMPEYLEQFYSIVLETFSSGFDGKAGDLFSRLFEGSVTTSAADESPSILYNDPSGFGVEIDSSGSGVVSTFPIVAAMYRIEGGGTLIVEEPESHMEPTRQMRLVSEVVRVALERKVSLVLTTHSDFVVHAVLGMVHDGVIDPADLGLYYFRRRQGEYTRVERIPVNRAGEAEMELFSEALDALAKGGAIPVDP